ncbi:6-phosphofructokinase [Vibrio algivorus]|uniref:6-phosphofructokinase n=1 Tax=Vibrio algivorus TaxID=1667024 RepID=A0ABQ6ELB9_9VIBR|nr:6-phosphofructokinase [Vibrio algivorus]GLT13794.1 ATP-dependent 6-phosphofructokinase [Vibrio algivorus]
MKIAIAISGGDAVGINNFLLQIARLTEAEIFLYDGGINGLIKNKVKKTNYCDLVDYASSAMPILKSGRTKNKPIEDEYIKIVKNLNKIKIDAFILAGGDGSLQFLNKLSLYGINCFGVGMTIDNDVSGSEYTIGFATACEQIRIEVQKLRMTGRALPNRIFMIELLGAYSGELTLQSSIKSNADIALIPEYPITNEDLANKINQLLKVQNSVIILCSEGYTKEYFPGFQGAVDTVIKNIEPLVCTRIRKAIMGFSLRSGEPCCEEIYQGTIMAKEVIRCLESGLNNKAIIINSSNKAIPIDLSSIQRRKKEKEDHYVKLAKELKII